MAILNNSSYLNTLGISEGVGFHAWHPSIIDFLTEYGLSDWNGSRFVSAWTTGEQCATYNKPENPYMQRSALGQTWTNRVQVGTTGYCQFSIPEDDYVQIHTGADTALFYNRFTGKLYIYWLSEDPNAQTASLVRREVNSDWSLGTLTDCSTGLPAGGMMSPCFVQESANILHQWYVLTPFANAGDLQLWHSVSTDDGLSWGTPELCTNNVIPTHFPNYYPWHIDAKINPLNTNVVELVVTIAPDTIPGTPALDTTWEGFALVHARTRISDPTTIYVPLTEHLLDPLLTDSGEFDESGLYRSSFVPYMVDGVLAIDLWYNGISNPTASEQAKVGYTSGSLGLSFTSIAVRDGDEITLTTWGGATLYYGWDEAPATEYTGVLTIPTGASELRYRALDGPYEEEVKTLSVSTGPIYGNGYTIQLKGAGSVVYPFNIKTA